MGARTREQDIDFANFRLKSRRENSGNCAVVHQLIIQKKKRRLEREKKERIRNLGFDV